MIYSLIIRVIERIPTIKDLHKRLKNSLEFRFDCGFTLADSIPSEASYWRMIKKIQTSSAIAKSQDDLVHQAEYFQLNNIRHRGKRAQVDFQFSILAYTLCKLAVNRLNKSLEIAA